jgi:proline iminopeptidase
MHFDSMLRHGVAALALLAAVPACRPRAGTESAPAEGFLTGAAGAQIFYQVAGTGEDTVVVVHGGPGAGIDDVRPDLEPLTKSHVVIFYDQRGGGRSELPKDTTQLGPGYFTGDLEAVRAHFHLDRMALVAVSFGAIVVAEYARAHPDRIARMVFLGATGPNRKEAARFYGRPPVDTALGRRHFELLRTLMEGRADDPVAACREEEQLSRELERAAGEFAGRKGTACNMPPPAVRYYYQYTARLGPEVFGNWDYTQSLGGVSAPLLVIDGERDTLGLPMERAWTRALPNAQLLIIPDAGRAVHAERPAAVFPAINEFLSGRWPMGARPSTS